MRRHAEIGEPSKVAKPAKEAKERHKIEEALKLSKCHRAGLCICSPSGAVLTLFCDNLVRFLGALAVSARDFKAKLEGGDIVLAFSARPAAATTKAPVAPGGTTEDTAMVSTALVAAADACPRPSYPPEAWLHVSLTTGGLQPWQWEATCLLLRAASPVTEASVFANLSVAQPDASGSAAWISFWQYAASLDMETLWAVDAWELERTGRLTALPMCCGRDKVVNVK